MSHTVVFLPSVNQVVGFHVSLSPMVLLIRLEKSVE